MEIGAARTGRTPNRADWRLVREVFVADTDEEAWRLSVDGMMGRMMREYFLPLMGNFGFLDFFKHDPDVADSDVTPAYCAKHNWLVGSPGDGGGEDREHLPQAGGFGGLLVFGFDYADNSGGLAQFAAPAGRGGRAARGASEAVVARGATMPEHDLAALWEEHCRYEFDTRDVDATMATMVAAPYVNHIPTMAGGVGHDQLKRFYKYHFIGANPPDMTLTPVSRTVGADRLVDEMVVRFTHTTMIDWMLPGIAPTGRSVEIADGGDRPVPRREAWRTSTSIGTRHRCWCRSASWIRRVYRWRVPRPRARCWTRTCRATRCCATLGGAAKGSRSRLRQARGPQTLEENGLPAMRPSALLDQHRQAIRDTVTAHRASNPRVFGSVLHREDTDASDLDLLVDPAEGMTLFDLGAIRWELRKLLGIEVDVVTPRALPASFRTEVLRNAQPV